MNLDELSQALTTLPLLQRTRLMGSLDRQNDDYDDEVVV